MFHLSRQVFAFALVSSAALAQTGIGDSNPREFVSPPLALETFFFASKDMDSSSLYSLSHLTGGLQELATFPSAVGVPEALAGGRVGPVVFFAADDGSGDGEELWMSNGSPAGTMQVEDIAAGSDHSAPRDFVALADGTVLFTAWTPGAGRELWQTNGTGFGTTIVEIRAGTEGSFPLDLTRVGEVVYFSANDGASGRELWKFEGGVASRVADIVAGPGGSYPHDFERLGDEVVFAAQNDGGDTELYKSNGTGAGTILLKDIRTSGSSRPKLLTNALGIYVYFSADDGVHGAEVWRTDGTTAGTVLVADVNVGPDDSNPTDLVAGYSQVWFVAEDGVTGPELWATNGYSVGATQVVDVNPDSAGTPPMNLTLIGLDELLFTADDGADGRELWKAMPGGAALFDDASAGLGCGSAVANVAQPLGLGAPTLLCAHLDPIPPNTEQLGYELHTIDGSGVQLVANIDSAPDEQPMLDVSHYLRSSVPVDLAEIEWKLRDATPGAFATLFIGLTAAQPLDLSQFFPPSIEVAGDLKIDLGAVGLVPFGTISPTGTLSFAISDPISPGFIEAASTQIVTFDPVGMDFALSDNLSLTKGKLDLDSAGCPGLDVKVIGSYIDNREDYCLTVYFPPEEVEWVVFVKKFDSSNTRCEELKRVRINGDTTTTRITKKLAPGESIEARIYCGPPDDDCSVTTGYAKCTLGC